MSAAMDALQESDLGSVTTASTAEGETTETPPAASVADALAENSDYHESAVDKVWDSKDVIQIALEGDTASSNGKGVTVDGGVVTITTPGTYSLSGSLVDGQIIVDTKGEVDEGSTVRLILNGVTLANTVTAPINIVQAEKTIITLAENTQNSVSGGSNLADTDAGYLNAAIYSADDLTISGSGSLLVDGTGQDGITCKDGLILAGGEITVNAVDDGIRGKDYLVVKSGVITVDAQGDGLKSDNDQDDEQGYIYIEDGTLDITSGGDAIYAQTDVLISGGTFTLVTGGGSSLAFDPSLSAKGIKADVQVNIDGGSFDINAADDAVHSNDNIVINDGTFMIATGDDGFHADSLLEINGGSIRITESYEGLESAVININGGEIYISAEDDGINIVGGVDGSGMMMPGQGMGGRTPPGGDFTQGDRTPPEGELPEDGRPVLGEMPQGGWPGQDNFAYTGSNLLSINGGYVLIDAGGDGIDANGSIKMTDGVVLVNGPTENMNGALDCIGSFTISGGFLVAAGSAGMAEAPDDSSTQPSLLLNFTNPQQAGTLVHIRTSAGAEILTFAPSKTYQSIAFSSVDLVEGEMYEVYLGGTSTGIEADGLYQDGVVTAGAQYTSFSISEILTRIGQRIRR